MRNPHRVCSKATGRLLGQASELTRLDLVRIVPVVDPMPTRMEVLVLVDSGVVILRERGPGVASS